MLGTNLRRAHTLNSGLPLQNEHKDCRHPQPAAKGSKNSKIETNTVHTYLKVTPATYEVHGEKRAAFKAYHIMYGGLQY